MAAISDTLPKALHAFQSKALKIQQEGINPAFKSRYVKNETLFSVVIPELNSCGLVLMQMPSFGPNGEPAMTTRITHMASGEALESTMPLLLDKQNAQGLGSAITYARRYMLMSMLGLVADEDDDGNRASRVAPADRQQASLPAAGASPTPREAGATDPQRQKLDELRTSLVEADAITADAAAKLALMVADPELTREKAREVLDALLKIQKEKVPA